MGAPSSALTAALHSSTNAAQPRAAGPEAGVAANVKSGAFPCLFQDGTSAVDTFEVELDIERLNIRSPIPEKSVEDRVSNFLARQHRQNSENTIDVSMNSYVQYHRPRTIDAAVCNAVANPLCSCCRMTGSAGRSSARLSSSPSS